MLLLLKPLIQYSLDRWWEYTNVSATGCCVDLPADSLNYCTRNVWQL